MKAEKGVYEHFEEEYRRNYKLIKNKYPIVDKIDLTKLIFLLLDFIPEPDRKGLDSKEYIKRGLNIAVSIAFEFLEDFNTLYYHPEEIDKITED